MDGTPIEERLEEDAEPTELFIGATTSGRYVIEGFGVALENMQPGNRWEFWIPWPLAYGSTGSKTNGVYTVLP
ncbi:MAG: FKBP-type peptidyl-prolyl cis-trans isomerase, partial [Tannerellaceae bacterium]|nr:FKBP-type peptidyl-prolyl cis-trans isomerase [Tannerellaceae bacterium]